MNVDRIPPSNLEAEMAVLGSVLVERDSYEIAAEFLEPIDFYAKIHEMIFATMRDLFEAGSPVDKIAIAEAMRTRGELDKVGGLPYLSSLMDAVPTAASVKHYAEIVREKSDLRALIHAGGRITALGFDGEVDVNRARDEAADALRLALDRNVETVGVSLGAAARQRIRAATDLAYGIAPDDTQKTPWPSLNGLVGGFRPGELVIWAGGAKAGKSAAVATLMDFVAAKYGGVAFFAFEMGTEAMAERMLALHSGVSVRAQRNGELNDDDLERLADAGRVLESRPIALFGAASSRLSDMRREMRALSKRTHLAAIAVDYVGFTRDVDPERGDRSTKHERLDRVYRELLRIAKEFRVVVHVVQHVNRDGMQGRPSIANIRDGGNPEGHAHAVILPYRPNPTGTAKERTEGEFIVAAVREGDAGILPMRFVGHRGMWLDDGVDRPWFESSAK
jgi:replicative DNA helicase